MADSNIQNEEDTTNTTQGENLQSNVVEDIPPSVDLQGIPNEIVEEAQTETVENSENIKEFDEIEEEYEEEIEENGEVKIIVKKRLVKVEKSFVQKLEEPITVSEFEEEEIEEEYEEDEVDETGETKKVTKKRIVKVPKIIIVKEKSVESVSEIDEEYEEEEIDETGQSRIVKKTRKVKVTRGVGKEELLEVSFEEIEEDYEEEELNENGETVTIIKKRMVKIPKKKVEEEILSAIEESTDIEKKESVESVKEEVKTKDSADKLIEGDLDVEELEDEDIEEEEDLGEEEEDVLDEDELTEEGRKVKERRKGREREETSVSEENEDEFREKKKRRQRRRKRKALKKEESRSEVSIEIEKEDEEDMRSKESAEVLTEGEVTQTVSLSSAEIRAAEERAMMAQEFENLTRLRLEHTALKKKTFFLNNKLIQYFKKQKMDHVFTETKEDVDVEQKYYRKLTEFFEINKEAMVEKLKINAEWELQRSTNEDLSEQVKKGIEELFAYKREVAAKLIDPRTGRTVLHDKNIEDLLMREENIMKQISECRLVQIKLQQRIDAKKQERQMEHAGRDFNLMDYEKLASLKEYYMDKITERDVEIGEVSQKMHSMDENLSTIKANLKIKEEELEKQQKRLNELTSELNKKRANLNKIKANRHKTEKNTAKWKQQSGLLAYPMLLKDYEEKSRRMQELKENVEALKTESREAVQRIRKLREIVRKKTLSKKNSNISTLTTSRF